MFVASSKLQYEDKPDMIGAITTYLWQTPVGNDAKFLRASDSGSSTDSIHADMRVFLPVSAYFVFKNQTSVS